MSLLGVKFLKLSSLLLDCFKPFLVGQNSHTCLRPPPPYVTVKIPNNKIWKLMLLFRVYMFSYLPHLYLQVAACVQHALTNVRAMIFRLPRWLAGRCSLWNIQYARLLVVSNNFWMILQWLPMICWWFFSDFLTPSLTCWFSFTNIHHESLLL